MAQNLNLSPTLYSRRGLGDLGELLKAGTPIRVGFNVQDTGYFSFSSSLDAEEIKNCLYTYGAFEDGLKVTLSAFPLRTTKYLLIEGVTAIDFGQPNDVVGAILQNLGYCYGNTDFIISQDPLIHGDPPPEFKSAPNVAKSNVAQYEPQRTIPVNTKEPPPPDKPDKCKFDDKGKEREGLDYLGCKLGLTTPSVGFGAVGGLAVAIVAAVVIAKAVK